MALFRNTDSTTSIRKWLKKSNQDNANSRHEDDGETQEERELKLALELSRKEHEEEQRQILDRIAKRANNAQSRSVIDLSCQTFVDQAVLGESDDDFQTTIPRPVKRRLLQKKKTSSNTEDKGLRNDKRKESIKDPASTVKLKHEQDDKTNSIEIDDLSDWINVKEEACQTEAGLDIDDLSAWIDAPTQLLSSQPPSSNSPPSSPPHTPSDYDTFINESTQRREAKGKQPVYEILDDDTDIMDITHTKRATGVPQHSIGLDRHSEMEKTYSISAPMGGSEVLQVQCPICSQSFPGYSIEKHASTCSGTDTDLRAESSSARRSSPFEALDRRLEMDSHPYSRFHNINDTQKIGNAKREQCPLCHEWLESSDLQQHVDDELRNDKSVSDEEDSDCSVLDLCASQREEEDDGYLSPLDGFVNILEHRDEDPGLQEYFDHITPTSTSRTPRRNNGQGRRRGSSSSRGRGGVRKKWYPYRRNHKKKGNKTGSSSSSAKLKGRSSNKKVD
ncbi:hypothetical protein EC973_007793 [Apophysomyces ossiformis]|uniref:UBZ4-type domain-containing protein n=1 Tax=Apophysomyces ossiformis TaxID=679940 RepID=A0A8H7BXJ5_9FUNG|nr:hypothetical protein EC973_007793 [Apophysomyces ossiformis]